MTKAVYKNKIQGMNCNRIFQCSLLSTFTSLLMI